MLQFNKSQANELKKYIYESYIHDAKIQDIQYDRTRKVLHMEIANSINKEKLNFAFRDVKYMLWVSGTEMGDGNAVNSFTVEEDYSFLQLHSQAYNEDATELLYLLFQMFSGDELHILCGEVVIEEYDG